MKKKVIATNATEMNKFYGSTYQSEIEPTIEKLIEADAQRGIETTLVYLDQVEGAPTPANPERLSRQEVKERMNIIIKDVNPEYLLILGGPSVVPHQKLITPYPELVKLIAENHPNYPDDSRFIESDFPYASTAEYSKKLNSFFKDRTVAIGRIGFEDKDSKLMITALNSVVNYTAKPKSYYENYFSVVSKFVSLDLKKPDVLAEKVVDKLFLGKVFDNVNYSLSSPNTWEDWTKEEMACPMHVIIAHSYPFYPYVLGQGDNLTFKIALSEESIDNRLTEGNIVVSSACYATRLYNKKHYYTPFNYLTNITSLIPDGNNPQAQRGPLCNTYFKNGNVAFLGSTFWGGDFRILVFFLQELMKGCSTGEALMHAQDRLYHLDSSISGEIGCTLASSVLLGDPSIAPVEETDSLKSAKTAINKTFKDLPFSPALSEEQKTGLEQKIFNYILSIYAPPNCCILC